MNTVKHKIVLDVSKHEPQLATTIRKGDSDSRVFEFSLRSNGKQYIITDDCTVVFRAKKPDGTVLFNNCLVNNSVATYTLTSQTTAVEGVLACQLEIVSNSGMVLYAPQFDVVVEDIVYSDDEIESESEMTVITENVAIITNMRNEVIEAQTEINAKIEDFEEDYEAAQEIIDEATELSTQAETMMADVIAAESTVIAKTSEASTYASNASASANRASNASDSAHDYRDMAHDYAGDAEYYANETKEIADNMPSQVTEYIASHQAELKGDKGDRGEQGLQGDKGEQGEQGLKGDKGDNGKGLAIQVDEPTDDDIVFWINPNENPSEDALVFSKVQEVGEYEGTETEFYQKLGKIATTDDVAENSVDTILDKTTTTSSNVLDIPNMVSTTKNGITVSISNGVITVDGTCTSLTEFALGGTLLEDGRYSCSYEVISGTCSLASEPARYMYSSGSELGVSAYPSYRATNVSGANRSKIKFFVGTYSNLKFHIWANKGDGILPYQPYGSGGGTVISLKESIKVTRFDEHIVNADVHVTKAEKDAWNGMIADDSLFDNEVKQTVTDSLQAIKGNSLAFAIMTDSHVYPSNANSVRQFNSTINHIKRINQNVPLDGLVHLGDMVNTQWLWQNPSTTDAEYQRLVAEYVNNLKKSDIADIYVANGNHDGGYTSNSDGTLGAEYSSYSANFRNTSKIAKDVVRPTNVTNEPYYYVDYPSLKLRCIFISTNIDSPSSDVKGIHYNQVLWIKNVLTEIPNDYNVMMFGHICFSIFYDKFKSNGASESFVAMVNGFNSHSVVDLGGTSLDADFTSKSGNILAYICGHYHGDRIILPTDEKAIFNFAEATICASGYLSSGVITSGSYYDSSDAPSRTLGTVTEDAFDIVVYSPTDSKIYFKRFGAGGDRVINL